MSRPKVLNITCVWPAGRLLGEGPWWSDEEQALYWVDIKRPAILRYRPSDGAKDEWRSPEPIGCFAPRKKGGFVGGFQSGLYTFSLPAIGGLIERQPIAMPPGHHENDRFNDGKCASDGSFWAGTMDNAEERVSGYFYKLDPAGKLSKISGPYKVCNGPAFSPDGNTIYFTDSAAQTIFRAQLNNSTIVPVPHLQFSEADGYPDGMTIDREGRLWVAFWDGSKIVCFDADGKRLMEIGLPVSRVTSCTFGGSKLDTLYVTTASVGLDDVAREREQLAGGLFAVELAGVTGFPPHEYQE